MRCIPWLKFFVIGGLTGLLSGCGEYGDFNQQQICRATVAAIKGKSPSILMVDKEQLEPETKLTVFYLSYNRPDDGKKWHFRCKVDKKRVVWAQGNGRWRDQAQDPTVRFVINSDEIKINETFPDGSESSDVVFNISQLGGR